MSQFVPQLFTWQTLSCEEKLVGLCESDRISHSLAHIIIMVKVVTFYVRLVVTAESDYIIDQLYDFFNYSVKIMEMPVEINQRSKKD